MADEKKPEGAEEEKKEKGGLGSKLPMIVMLINLVGMGLGGYLSYLGTLGMSREAIRELETRSSLYDEEIFNDKPVIYSLDPFTVNLADIDDQRIVQVQVTLEMLNETGFEEVISMGAYARDTIVHILNGKEFNELQTIQGKLFLKDEITVALNQQLQRSFIKDVYFSKFVLQ